MNILSGKYLSDIIGAHDLSDFVMEVQLVSASSHVLVRGAVVCRKADGTVTLAGAEGTGPDDVFGIVLNFGTDPSSGGATASVARSGVYDAVQLTVDPGVELRDFADRLRERGIFLEKLEMVGIIPVPEMATVAAHPTLAQETVEPEQPQNPSKEDRRGPSYFPRLCQQPWYG
jgi:hypothetical protein